eukprot:714105_1
MWKHFMIRNYGLLQQYTHLINKELKTLRDKLDGGGDGADGDGTCRSTVYKNLNHEYVQTLAIMGFPLNGVNLRFMSVIMVLPQHPIGCSIIWIILMRLCGKQRTNEFNNGCKT